MRASRRSPPDVPQKTDEEIRQWQTIFLIIGGILFVSAIVIFRPLILWLG